MMMSRSHRKTFTFAILLVTSSIPSVHSYAPISARPLYQPQIGYHPAHPLLCRKSGDCMLHQSQLGAASSKQEMKSLLPDEIKSALKKTTIRAWIPMWLTYSRCIMIPILVYVFYRPQSHVLAPLIFGAASFTDWFDGYLARRWKVESSFGAFLDPVVRDSIFTTFD
jgi:CDP-alcohol phosphatidyltransferase